ncbi:MAG: hypothetical protein ACKN9K_28920, partial [Dolichospermum sp.]
DINRIEIETLSPYPTVVLRENTKLSWSISFQLQSLIIPHQGILLSVIGEKNSIMQRRQYQKTIRS